jgi:hypothetical protein
MARQPKKRSPVKVHVHGNLAHNASILLVIGQLVVNWANNESVFMAMLQALVPGGEHTAAIIWQSQRTSRPRLDLVLRLVREQVKDAALVNDIEQAIAQFGGFSRARNFYCHATYDHDPTDGAILSAHGMVLSDQGDPLISETKLFNAATMNEIVDVSTKLAIFNRHLWGLVVRLQASLGVQRVKLPELPPLDQQLQTSHPPKSTDASPQSPPESSGA